MTKQDQPDKSIPAYMNGNGAPRTGDWFYWWCRVKGCEGDFLYCLWAAPLQNYVVVFNRCSLQKYDLWEWKKRGRTHMWEQAQLTHNLGFQFSEN